MTTTHTTSGGGFYATAVQLRADAATARESYPLALAKVRADDEREVIEAALHAPMLMLQAVGFEIAAALYCVAQAIEDANTAQPQRENL